MHAAVLERVELPVGACYAVELAVRDGLQQN